MVWIGWFVMYIGAIDDCLLVSSLSPVDLHGLLNRTADLWLADREPSSAARKPLVRPLV